MQTRTCIGFSNSSKTRTWLAHIANLLGADAALLGSRNPDGQQHFAGTGHPESAIDEYRENFHTIDPMPALLHLRPEQRSIVIDVNRHPAYRAQREYSGNFLQKNGIVHILGFAWLDANDCHHIIQLHRLAGGLPFLTDEGRDLEQWVHHWRINEATPAIQGLSGQQTHERRRGDIAAQLAIPLAVLDGSIKVIWANPAAWQADDQTWKSLLHDQRQPSSCECIRPQIHKLVRRCLSQHSKVEAVFSINDEKHFAVVTPLDGQPGLSLLQMSDLNHEIPGIKVRLQRLLKLSPAESELAVLLATGASLASIAEFRQVAQGTIRAQLQTIYRKTETHRQSELVCLIQGLSQS